MAGLESWPDSRDQRATCSAVSVALIVLAIEFSVATCQVSISLYTSQEHGSLCSPIVLICSFDNLHFVRIEEYVADGIRFSPLTTNYISGNPDYEEVVSDGLYQLRITQVERHNGTRYRCHGFIEDLSAEFNSDEWKLVVPSKEVCAILEMNVTVTMEPNNTCTVNSTMQATSVVEEREQAPTWNSALLSIIAVLPVVALTAAVLCAVVACTRKRAKAGMATLHADSHVNNVPAPVQEDGNVASTDLPVMAEIKVDHVSTHVGARFSEHHPILKIEAQPGDRDLMLPHLKGPKTISTMCQASSSVQENMSIEVVQTPQVASNNDAAGAIQIAGNMVKYDNIRLQLKHTHLQSAVQQHPAVPCAEVPAPLIPSRSDHELEPVPIQSNPAYEALETIIPSAQAAGRVHQLQPSTRTDLLEDVCMQGNPAYEALETAIPSTST